MSLGQHILLPDCMSFLIVFACSVTFYETFKTTFCSNLIEHFDERSSVKRFSMFKNLKAFYIDLQTNLQTTTGVTEN